MDYRLTRVGKMDPEQSNTPRAEDNLEPCCRGLAVCADGTEEARQCNTYSNVEGDGDGSGQMNGSIALDRGFLRGP